MTDHPEDRLRYCEDIVHEQNTRFGWGLTPFEEQQYARQMARCMPDGCSPFILRRMVQSYHDDHELVEALGDHTHPHHEAAWKHVLSYTEAILRQRDIAWTNDLAFDTHDFAQLVCMELIRSLPTFAYQSRFSTWHYKVIVQRAQRQFRANIARKRNGGRPGTSLDDCTDGAAFIDRQGEAHLLTQATAQMLATRMLEILEEQGDARLAHIFQLWAMLDKHVDDIGALFELHPSRIRQLLKLARQILAQHPEIVAWQHDNDAPM
jgi:RNA polymerase sigma factor (sigma-70 family)